jgi:hypothetical protein
MHYVAIVALPRTHILKELAKQCSCPIVLHYVTSVGFRTALMHYVDIVALPRTHILKELAKYAEDPAERDKLLLMADTSAEG